MVWICLSFLISGAHHEMLDGWEWLACWCLYPQLQACFSFKVTKCRYTFVGLLLYQWLLLLDSPSENSHIWCPHYYNYMNLGSPCHEEKPDTVLNHKCLYYFWIKHSVWFHSCLKVSFEVLDGFKWEMELWRFKACHTLSVLSCGCWQRMPKDRPSSALNIEQWDPCQCSIWLYMNNEYSIISCVTPGKKVDLWEPSAAEPTPETIFFIIVVWCLKQE